MQHGVQVMACSTEESHKVDREGRGKFAAVFQRLSDAEAKQLAGVLDIIKRQSAARKGKEVNEEELAMMKQLISGKVEHESTARYATARLWDDGIIDPADTRDVIGLALSACASAPFQGAEHYGVFRH